MVSVLNVELVPGQSGDRIVLGAGCSDDVGEPICHLQPRLDPINQSIFVLIPSCGLVVKHLTVDPKVQGSNPTSCYCNTCSYSYPSYSVAERVGGRSTSLFCVPVKPLLLTVVVHHYRMQTCTCGDTLAISTDPETLTVIRGNGIALSIMQPENGTLETTDFLGVLLNIYFEHAPSRPDSNLYSALVTVTVSDGELETMASTVVHVTVVNQAPEILLETEVCLLRIERDIEGGNRDKLCMLKLPPCQP